MSSGSIVSGRRAETASGAQARALSILMLAPYLGGKGPLPKHTPVLVDSLRRLGCEVTVQTWGYRDEFESLARKIWDRGRDVLLLRRLAERGGYDVIVVKTGHDWRTLTRDIPLLLATRGMSCKQVLQFHGSSPESLLAPGHRIFKSASRLLIRLSDAVMVLSRAEEKAWNEFYPSRDVYVVANPLVPRSEAGASVGGAACPAASDCEPPMILFVGRLTRAKGLFELLEAARLLQAEHPDIPWRLVIAGEGPDSAALQSLSEQSGLADRVEFPGYLVGEQLDAAYRAASVFVLPSYAEGFPTVVTEAMAAGLPIVATSIRGLIDYLEDGVNALFVEPRDALGLYHALARLLQDEDLRRSMGRANRERVKIFEPDAVGSRYLSTLEAILARPDHS